MNKKMPVLLTVVFSLLVACSFSQTFTGTIEKIENQNAIVAIEDGEILKSGNKASVDLSVANETIFQVGEKVKVGYDNVGERNPLYIETKTVELID